MMRRDAVALVSAFASILVLTAVYRRWLGITNPTTAALTFLLVVLVVAATSRLWIGVVTSIAAMLCLNYFFLPPVGTWTIADPENWVALFTFLAVSLVASNLSAAIRDRAAARESEQLKSALLASIGHNLRTPLTAIRVAASNLHASWLTDAERQEQAGLVLVEVERLGRVVENILELARIDAGAIATDPRWVDPAEIVTAARNHVAHALAGRQIEIEGEPYLVRVDPRLTAVALSHVLENAAQYTPSASPISVRTAIRDGELMISVRDQGPGVTPADLPHLFDRFFRGTASGHRASGTGMGLAIARGLVAAERGRIWAENCSDGGALFTIAIPTDARPALDAETMA